jgi:hypothetical protein
MSRSGRSNWAKSLLVYASRIQSLASSSAALRFLFAATLIVWGCIYLFIRGKYDNNFFYVMVQCLWKSYGSLEQYSKSGREFSCVSSILQQSSKNHAGFFDASFPTDKASLFCL